MTRRQPQAGDWAHHKAGLDVRRVTRVGFAVPVNSRTDRKVMCVGLQIGTVEAWPCPARNYFFTSGPAKEA